MTWKMKHAPIRYNKVYYVTYYLTLNTLFATVLPIGALLFFSLSTGYFLSDQHILSPIYPKYNDWWVLNIYTNCSEIQNTSFGKGLFNFSPDCIVDGDFLLPNEIDSWNFQQMLDLGDSELKPHKISTFFFIISKGVPKRKKLKNKRIVLAIFQHFFFGPPLERAELLWGFRKL